jgi:hypothetical protein
MHLFALLRRRFASAALRSVHFWLSYNPSHAPHGATPSKARESVMALRSNSDWTVEELDTVARDPRKTRGTVNLVNFPLGEVLHCHLREAVTE